MQIYMDFKDAEGAVRMVDVSQIVQYREVMQGEPKCTVIMFNNSTLDFMTAGQVMEVMDRVIEAKRKIVTQMKLGLGK